MTRHTISQRYPRAVALLLSAAMPATIGPVCNAWATPASSPGDIIPLTTIDGSTASGYLTDPQPIHLSPRAGSGIQYLSGTTHAIVRCSYPLRAKTCGWSPIQIDVAGLQQQMTQAGVNRTNIQNIDVYQAADGSWHAAVTIGVNSPGHPKHWTVVAHAHAVTGPFDGAPPTNWSADTLLAGSFDDPTAGNYDGKYYEENGRLYLLYVRNTHPAPAIRNEIVLQPMISFQRAGGSAIALLSTGDRFGELSSEQYANTQAKLVEAPWLVVVGGKHALIYSTGGYLTPGYKTGVAWSDTLIPAGDGRYRKVLKADPNGIWRSAGGRDVDYLLQSERPRWPNFVAGEVVGPGVASVTQGPKGGWWLMFNGFDPGDMPRKADGTVDGSHRRPFAMRLQASVPVGRPVANASDAELATWLTAAD